VQLSEPLVYPFLPRWSPDGTQIMFYTHTPQGPRKTYIVSAQGGSVRPLLPEDSGSQSDPNWSPDGRNIAFDTKSDEQRGGESEIRILDFSTRQITTLAGSAGIASPRWSPDCRSIATANSDATVLHIFDIKTKQWSTPYKDDLAYPEGRVTVATFSSGIQE
jgi:eukaryotic-like serine/threonine-protein kinase